MSLAVRDVHQLTGAVAGGLAVLEEGVARADFSSAVLLDLVVLDEEVLSGDL